MLDLKSLIPFHRHDKSSEVARPADVNSDPFLAMRREMDRMFGDFLSRQGWLTPTSANDDFTLGLASLEITDGEKEITVSVELPGMSEKDVDVKISGDILTIEGEKSEESENKDGDRTWSERRYGKFSRSIRLPFVVGDEKAEADFDKGVLTIRVAKPANEQTSSRHIEVKAA